jgi:hypothetical protein
MSWFASIIKTPFGGVSILFQWLLKLQYRGSFLIAFGTMALGTSAPSLEMAAWSTG